VSWAAGTSADVVRGAVALTFLHPESWVVAVAGFLARGGIVVLTVPILVLPTVADLSSLGGPLIGRFVTGSVDGALLAAIGLAVLACTLAVALLLWVGGAVDAELIAIASDDLGRVATGGSARGPWSIAGRLALARTLAFLPLVVILALSSIAVLSVATDELLRPGDLATPVTLRVIGRLPLLVGVVIAVAALCETLASLATRAIALDGSTVGGSIGAALRAARRRPRAVVVALLATLAVSVILLVPAILALVASFGGVRTVVMQGGDPAVVIGGAFILVACWLGAMVLAGIAGALRSFAWTCVHLETSPVPALEPAGQPDRHLAP
jgi:hypothetical protein